MRLRTKVRGHRLVSTGIGAILLSVGAGANAQTDQTTKTAEAALEEVTVTAERFSSSVQTVPIAVTAISGDALVERSVSTVLDAAEEIPGILIEPMNTPGGEPTAMRVATRGALQELQGFRNSAVMGMYIDNFIQPMINGAFFDFADMQRVEVLRGPQGTLYGRNSSGGAMKLVTKRPSFDWTGEIELGAGNWDQKEAKAYLSGPIVDDTLAFSLSGVKRERAGFWYGLVPQRDVGRMDRSNWRAQLLYVPSDRVEVRWSVYGGINDSESGAAFPIQVLPGVYNPYAYPGRQMKVSEDVGDTQTHRVDLSTSLNAEITISDSLRITSVSGYGQQEYESSGGRAYQAWPVVGADGQPVPIGTNNDGTAKHKWWSQELNTTYENDRMRMLVGLYYFVQEGGTRSTTEGSDTVDADQKITAPAVFAQLNYSLTDTVSLILGHRYTVETNNYYQFDRNVHTQPAVGKSKYKVKTPKLGVEWQVTPTLFTYASYTKGFRAGSFNNRDPLTGQEGVFGYAPEFVDSYEIGGKYQTEDGRFRVNTAIYRAVYEHLHQAVYIPNTNFTATLPSAGARVDGIEMEPSWQVTRALQIYGNLSLTDGKYTDPFICADEYSVRQDCSNRKIKQLIPVKSNLGFRITPDFVWMPGKLTVNFSWAYTSPFKINLANGPAIIQPRELNLFNARVAWTDDSGRWRVSVESRNLFDKEYFAGSAVRSNPISPELRLSAGDPRTVIGHIGYKF
jgi:iron complex outermembrane receptor protein